MIRVLPAVAPLAATLLIRLLTPLMAETFHVSSTGQDTSAGSVEQPFATPRRAQEAVRQFRRSHPDKPVAVEFAAGTYRLTEPLRFTTEDGGDEHTSVTWRAAPGAIVVISGGQRVSGFEVKPLRAWPWQRAMWVTPTSDVTPLKTVPRALFINGRRATRARWPDAGNTLSGLQTADGLTLQFPRGTLKPLFAIEDVELVFCMEWTPARTRLAAATQVEVENDRLIFPAIDVPAPRERSAITFFSHDWAGHLRAHVPNYPFWFENAYEFCDLPGEWYLGRPGGFLHYIPHDGEDPATAEVILPRLERLVEVVGSRDQPVVNLHIQGLTFAHTDAQLIDRDGDGYYPLQTLATTVAKDGSAFLRTHTLPAAVRFEYARDCSFVGNTITQTAGSGLSVERGCGDFVIARNTMTDIGGNGVQAGDFPSKPDEADLTRDIRIEDNTITRCGMDHVGGVGVFVPIAARVRIAHNEVAHLPYSGICIGWEFTHADTAARENVIEANHIHHTAQRLNDSGGIYTLGKQPGSVIRGNHIHHVTGKFALAWNNGIFMDNGSEGFTLHDNVVHDSPDGPLRFNDTGGETATGPQYQTLGRNFFDVHPDTDPQAAAVVATAGVRR